MQSLSWLRWDLPLPFTRALEVLRLQCLITEHVWVGGHGDELVCRHGLPDFVEEGAVVDAQGWGDAFSETGPVLEIVR